MINFHHRIEQLRESLLFFFFKKSSSWNPIRTETDASLNLMHWRLYTDKETGMLFKGFFMVVIIYIIFGCFFFVDKTAPDVTTIVD